MADGEISTHEHGEHVGHDHEQVTPCEAALQELYLYLDGEMTDERRTKIKGHLQDCNPCLEAFDFEAELRTVISRKCNEGVVPPEGLAARIAQALGHPE